MKKSNKRCNRDFDAFDLRLRLPAVLSKLYKPVSANGGVTYTHCTAGLRRPPAVSLVYMLWVLGYKLNVANSLLQIKSSCFPKLDAVKSATTDILTSFTRSVVTLKWQGRNFSSVEMAGLDIGWGQRLPLNFVKEKGSWTIENQLPSLCKSKAIARSCPRNIISVRHKERISSTEQSLIKVILQS